MAIHQVILVAMLIPVAFMQLIIFYAVVKNRLNGKGIDWPMVFLMSASCCTVAFLFWSIYDYSRLI
jgi:hypothetical protein